MSKTLPDTRPYLTRAERDLLAAISRYCRTAGWRYGGISGAGDFVAPDRSLDVDWWSYHRADSTVLQISTLSAYGTHTASICTAEVGSVAEAVDIAVAYGLLPADFSSAYRAALTDAAQAQSLAEQTPRVGWCEVHQHQLDACSQPTEVPCAARFFNPEIGERIGYVAAECGHAMSLSEWRVGFRKCERCAWDGSL